MRHRPRPRRRVNTRWAETLDAEISEDHERVEREIARREGRLEDAPEPIDQSGWGEDDEEEVWDYRHPDLIGVSRRPEPKSILSNPPASRFGSIPKPKAPKGKPVPANPYTYTRPLPKGRWQQRG